MTRINNRPGLRWMKQVKLAGAIARERLLEYLMMLAAARLRHRYPYPFINATPTMVAGFDSFFRGELVVLEIQGDGTWGLIGIGQYKLIGTVKGFDEDCGIRIQEVDALVTTWLGPDFILSCTLLNPARTSP